MADAKKYWVIIFVACLPLIVSFDILGFRITPLRLMLILSFIPSLIAVNKSSNGFMYQDAIIATFSLWIILSLIVVDGPNQIPNAVITSLETFGSYMLGRALICSKREMLSFLNHYIVMLVLIFPFAILELTTGRIYLHEILDFFGETVWKAESSRPRWGLERVMTGFEHPILYGLCCSMLGALYFYTRVGTFRKITVVFFLFCMTFMSLSSAPLLSIMIQAALFSWGYLTRNKWGLLFGIFVITYAIVDLASNRTPITILINYITFEPHTAWTRIATWEYGVAGIKERPIFGFGIGEAWTTWEKPSWLTDSVDSYWLVISMRHGLIGIALYLTFISVHIARIAYAKKSESISSIRTGYLVSLVGIIFVLTTVHIWGSADVLVHFFLGAGTWMIAASAQGHVEPVKQKERMAPKYAYTRFNQKRNKLRT